MRFFCTTLFATAILASTALAAASDHNEVHAPALRRTTGHHNKKRSSCSSSSKKGKKSSSKKGSSGKKTSSKTSSTNNDSSASKKTEDATTSSSDSSDDSSSSSSSGSSSDSSDDSSSSSSSTNSTGSYSGSGKSLSFSGKQGLAWPNSNGMEIDNFFIGDVDWYYSWGATPGWDSAPTDKVFCPMLWGDSGSGGNAAEFKSKVVNDQSGKYNKWKCALGMNEVNQKGQSDMTPAHACSLMKEYMMPLAEKDWYIVGPSTTSDPAGLTTWYKEFMSSCSDVFERLDAVAVHYYDVDVDNFKKYVANWHKVTGKDIWITEAACQNFNGGAQCSSSQARNFLTEMMSWVKDQDYVKAYSPFGVMQNLQGVSEVNRLSQGSNPTSLFKAFAST